MAWNILFQKERDLPIFGCHLYLRIHGICALAWKQGSSLHPSHKHQGRATHTCDRWKERQISLQRGGFPPALLGYLVLSVPYHAPSCLSPQCITMVIHIGVKQQPLPEASFRKCSCCRAGWWRWGPCPARLWWWLPGWPEQTVACFYLGPWKTQGSRWRRERISIRQIELFNSTKFLSGSWVKISE